MEDGSYLQIFLLVLCFLISSLYTMAESAYVALSNLRVRSMQDAGTKGADTVAKIKEDPDKFLTAMLIGANLFYIIATSMAALIAQHHFGEAGIAIAAIIMTFVTLVFGDITPKSLAVRKSEKLTLMLAPFVRFSIIIYSPLIPLVTVITRKVVKLLGGGDDLTPSITESELKSLVEVSHEVGVIEDEGKTMIDNVFEFGNTSAQDIMIPRTDIYSIKIDSDYDEIYQIFKDEGYSRMPVYEESLDNIRGILNFRDFILSDKDSFDINSLLREPYFTYESKPTVELLAVMREQRYSLAVVLDEYGGTSGILTRNDIVEEIMGHIGDEYDDPHEEEITIISDGEYSVLGQTLLEDVSESIGVVLESEDFETIGGYVVGLLGQIPEDGESIAEGELEFIVEHVDKNRIEKLKIIKTPTTENEENTEEDTNS